MGKAERLSRKRFREDRSCRSKQDGERDGIKVGQISKIKMTDQNLNSSIDFHEEMMRLAMEEAEVAVREGNAPFAVVAVKDGAVVWKDHDKVKVLMDPTAHGEINAIRALCKKLNTLSLIGYTFYTTSEPCPTCLSGMIKAKVSASMYGAKTESTASLPISAEYLAGYAKKDSILVRGGILAEECLMQRNKHLLK